MTEEEKAHPYLLMSKEERMAQIDRSMARTRAALRAEEEENERVEEEMTRFFSLYPEKMYEMVMGKPPTGKPAVTRSSKPDEQSASADEGLD